MSHFDRSPDESGRSGEIYLKTDFPSGLSASLRVSTRLWLARNDKLRVFYKTFENLNYIYYKCCLFWTVAKTMVEQKFCQGCNQKHDCQDIYQKLADFKVPSVVLKVVVAFLLPILVFIASLAAFERILAEAIDTEELRTALSFLLALSVAFGLMLIIKAINRQFGE